MKRKMYAAFIMSLSVTLTLAANQAFGGSSGGGPFGGINVGPYGGIDVDVSAGRHPFHMHL